MDAVIIYGDRPEAPIRQISIMGLNPARRVASISNLSGDAIIYVSDTTRVKKTSRFLSAQDKLAHACTTPKGKLDRVSRGIILGGIHLEPKYTGDSYCCI